MNNENLIILIIFQLLTIPLYYDLDLYPIKLLKFRATTVLNLCRIKNRAIIKIAVNFKINTYLVLTNYNF